MTTTADLAPCNVALVRVPLGLHEAAVVVEKHVAPYVKEADRRYKAHPLNRNYPIRKADTGAYNCRKTTSGGSWSKHAYGCAIDINWKTNPYGSVLVTDMPRWFIQIWLDLGFGWGGNWSGKKDAMHFSKFPNEGGDGILDGPPVSEEGFLPELSDDEQRLLFERTTTAYSNSFVKLKNNKTGAVGPVGIDQLVLLMAENPGKVIVGGPDAPYSRP